MEPKKETLAYKRTHKAIVNAFIELSETIPFSKMTVQNILDAAYVSRYTFYHHFPDKYAVAEEIQAELFSNFKNFMECQVPHIEEMSLPSSKHHATMNGLIQNYFQKNMQKANAIKDIHTDTIDFWKLCSSYVMDNYQTTYPATATLDLEAQIYAGIFQALEQYNLTHSYCYDTMSEDVLTATMRAALHSVGLHDEKKIEHLFPLIEKMLYPSQTDIPGKH